MKCKRFGYLVFLVGMASSSFTYAGSSFDEYVSGIRKEAQEKGISERILNSAFADVEYHKKAVVADKNQPEKRLTLDDYLVKALPAWKVKRAQSMYEKHYTELKRIGDLYGVQPRFIVALWGIESNFGRLMGRYNVVEALTTLAYEGRREAFFRNEVFSALTILEQGHITPEKMKGSWAGAMGQCQFMPSSYLNYAADGNGDGIKDIWGTESDVFASAANYLKSFGWDDTYTWGRQVKLIKPINNTLTGLDKNKAKSLKEWEALGVRRLGNRALPDVDIQAWLIQPDDGKGRSYLVYNNYQVLMRWNRSHYFALAVSHLADKLK
ncbi:lytic murein transglycosylase [Parasalinivibrio latis]|uniref:lytic murein transglycosylase n=1 Tax=Parasalinivibrio latis TaxID=2952610 RepID=UPI0030DF8B71